MIVVLSFVDEGPGFLAQARSALEALAARPGYLRGTIGRCTDDTEAWLMLTEWQNVGSYRRALGNYEVKLHATPLLSRAMNRPSGFEDLLDVAPGGAALARTSDHEPVE